MTDLLSCPFCGKQPTSKWYGAVTPDGDDGFWGIDCCRAHAHEDDEEAAAALWNRRAPAQTVTWRNPDETPDVKSGNEREFIVAVYRAHSGKVYTFACTYLNAFRVQYEECPKDSRLGFCDGCEDGCRTTGWFRLTGDDSNESGCYQSIDLRDGDKLLGWQPLPNWSTPLSSTQQRCEHGNHLETCTICHMWRSLPPAEREGS